MAAGETTDQTMLLPGSEAPERTSTEPLDHAERRQLDHIRRFGTTGSLILAAGAFGAGANPVINPIYGARFLGLLSRMPTVAMAICWLGMLMIVAAWLWLGLLCRPGRERVLGVGQLARTAAMWALPLALCPPLFSTDMYSYLAQSEVAARGFNPYLVSPLIGLGVDHPFTSNVPNIWRDTPSPYGPLFLMFGQLISRVIGDNVIFGVLIWRLVMLCGLALAIWAIPRLARRCGVHPAAALWLSVANPIVLFHVISGMHNEALMVGIMLTAIELGLRHQTTPGTIAAGVLLTIAGAIKPPGWIALGFFGICLVVIRGGRWRELFRVGALLGAVFLATMTVITVGSGWGLGWIDTFDVPNRVKTFMAPLTAFGMTGGGISTLLGLGNQTDAMLVITKLIGYVIVAAVCLWMLWLSFRGRVQPLVAMGATYLTLALAVPVLWPWYLLWSVVPLALSTNNSRFRHTATAICAAVSLLIPPTGAGFVLRAYQIPLAVIAAIIAFAITVALVRHRMPAIRPTLGRVRQVKQ
ncbi:polyprenol phosphomannose-dependent alpha 1,6 mannosyltransferase MptB [Saccharopolyspora sp. TS4A08]|uniref:Polyprenol phosphomannose-dependent alpha 1,6 mannosyltransferase MptB n=1 Tax=Saccharopolyspora ipomoeae TaxID=3042027 RepID=A0ABT6PHA2_9PSEU|nr:polyprenol phosphomannose-dependent alpha 1,6 mannosyltransferase MptB [Saccharopolyspora sp. TS4A08]MDI2027324.1 polyprenol phosphomannose-dependent alpha 1,6 mannosyltransferase MptB [Saccharopolyspora sp. TS4A08]